MVLDGLLMGALLYASYELRSCGLIRFDFLTTIPPFYNFYWMLALLTPICPLILDIHGFYEHPLTKRFDLLLPAVLKSGVWVILIISFFSIFGRLEIPSRTVLFLFLILAPTTLILRAVFTRKIMLQRYSHGQLGERSVIVGTAKDNNSFLAALKDSERIELQITQKLNLEDHHGEEIRRIMRQHAAGRVIFTSPESPLNLDLPTTCEEEGLDIWIVTKSIHGIFGVPDIDTVGNNRVLVFNRGRDFWHTSTKRFMDIMGAFLGLLILSPLFIAIAVGIKLTSPGPIIFRQVRSGKRGKRFTILKFRSMVWNAPELHADLAHKNEMEGPVFKIKGDPRITPFGAFLRQYSLDEIPQLINVLRGEMSLVGPRPLPDYETERIEKSTHRRRLSVKPGVTCLWQISGRNTIRSFEEWVQLDIEYIEKASLMLDLSIILRTIPVVIFRNSGAH